MTTISMLIVEKDERYVERLAIKLLEGMEDEIQLEVISDMSYFEEYSSTPKQIDVLVINEDCMNENIKKQNIKLTIQLCENEKNEMQMYSNQIYKYSNLQEIFYKIQGQIKRSFRQYQEQSSKQDTSLIMVYSPIGGSGKTVAAMGICSSLSELGKNVLYLNTETIQNFQSCLDDKEFVSNGFDRHLSIHEEGLMSYLQGAVGKDGFEYLRPIKYSTLSYGITSEDYLYFIDRLIESKAYEYVVLDVPSDFDEFVNTLMKRCNHVVIITNQNALAVYKTERLLENIDYSDQSKFMFICNRYEKEEDNHILRSQILSRCTITEYIDQDEMLQQVGSLYNIRSRHLMKSAAYLLM